MSDQAITQSTLEYVLGAEHGASLHDQAIRTARVCGSIVAAIGLMVLLGWLLELPMLTTVLPGANSMKFNAALALVLAGTGLILTTVGGTRAASIASFAATLVVLVGAASLFESAARVDLGIDELFVRDPAPPPGTAPGRMAGLTSIAFIMAGAGVLLLDVRVRLRSWISQTLAAGAACIAVLALGEHLYRDRSTYEPTLFCRDGCSHGSGAADPRARHRRRPPQFGHRNAALQPDAYEQSRAPPGWVAHS